jgi:hypothetical protein
MFSRYQNYTGYYFELNIPVDAEDCLPEHLSDAFYSMPYSPQKWLLNYPIIGADGKDLSNCYRSTSDISSEIDLDAAVFSTGKQALLRDSLVVEMLALMQEEFGAEFIKVKFGTLSYVDD